MVRSALVAPSTATPPACRSRGATVLEGTPPGALDRLGIVAAGGAHGGRPGSELATGARVEVAVGAVDAEQALAARRETPDPLEDHDRLHQAGPPATARFHFHGGSKPRREFPGRYLSVN